MKERGWKKVAGAAGMPPHNSEEWGDYRGKWQKEWGVVGFLRGEGAVTPNGIGT